MRLVAVADLDGLQVEWGEDELNAAPDQPGVDLVGVACSETVAVLVTVRNSLHRNASVRSSAVGIAGVRLTDPSQPPSAPAGSARSRYGSAGGIRFYPGDKQPVELQQCGRVIDASSSKVLAGRVGDLDQELLAHGAGRVDRAARCQRVLVLFRTASHRTDYVEFHITGCMSLARLC
jgi:hypothetical protein